MMTQTAEARAGADGRPPRRDRAVRRRSSLALVRGTLCASGVAAAALLSLEPAAAQETPWQVRCGDDLYCTATIDGQSRDGRPARFKLERSAKPDGRVFVTTSPDVDLAEGLRVDIDVVGLGEPYGVTGTVSRVYAGNEMTYGGQARRTLIENLRLGERAEVTVFFDDPTGRITYAFPLSGLTLALLEFDRRQDRMDRVDAIVAYGSRPAETPAPADAATEDPVEPSTVSAAAAPVQTDDPLSALGAEWPQKAILKETFYETFGLPGPVAAIGDELGCTADAISAFGVDLVTLESQVSLWFVPCTTADVNVERYVAAFTSNGGKTEVLNFRGSEGDAFVLVTNPVLDTETGVVSSVIYDAPDGSCGTRNDYALEADGVFALTRSATREACGGPASDPQAWPVTFERGG